MNRPQAAKQGAGEQWGQELGKGRAWSVDPQQKHEGPVLGRAKRRIISPDHGSKSGFECLGHL